MAYRFRSITATRKGEQTCKSGVAHILAKGLVPPVQLLVWCVFSELSDMAICPSK
jgi:hypothetical protein